MSEHHDAHGSTPAAWTAVTIIMVAFLIGGIAVWYANKPLFWFECCLGGCRGDCRQGHADDGTRRQGRCLAPTPVTDSRAQRRLPGRSAR